MSKEDKQRILATNRLLEILRAERGSDDVAGSEEVLTDSDLFIDDEDEKLQYAAQAEANLESETIKQDDDEFPSLFIDEETEIERIDEEHDIEGETFVDDDTRLFEDEQAETDDSIGKAGVDPEVAKLAASLTTSESESATSSDYSEDIKDDLLLKTELPKELDESDSVDIVLPPEFNDSLITFYDKVLKGKYLIKKEKQGEGESWHVKAWTKELDAGNFNELYKGLILSEKNANELINKKIVEEHSFKDMNFESVN